jgi:hypothetical protein
MRGTRAADGSPDSGVWVLTYLTVARAFLVNFAQYPWDVPTGYPFVE